MVSLAVQFIHQAKRFLFGKQLQTILEAVAIWWTAILQKTLGQMTKNSHLNPDRFRSACFRQTLNMAGTGMPSKLLDGCIFKRASPGIHPETMDRKGRNAPGSGWPPGASRIISPVYSVLRIAPSEAEETSAA
jgi:hypothetical protein